MKYLAILYFLLGCNRPEPPLTFKEIMRITDEIAVNDSILLDYSSVAKKPLDSVTGKKLWEIIHDNKKEMIYNADYSIAGKITWHPKMNILLFGIERASNPDGRHYGISQELHIIVLDKKENYKYSHEASFYWDIKRDNKIIGTEKSVSWLDAEFRLRSGDSNWWGCNLQSEKIVYQVLEVSY